MCAYLIYDLSFREQSVDKRLPGGLAFGGDGGAGGVACLEPGSCFNTDAGTSSNAEAEVEV